MLNKLEIGQFHSFGFIVIKECLGNEEVKAAQEAFDRAIEAAPAFTDFGKAGTRRSISFLDEEESLGALIEHPKIMEAMRELDGTEFLYTGGGDLTANVDNVFWHTDGNPSKQPMTAKTAVYLSDSTDGDGALNIIPGSFHPEFSAAIYRSYAPLGAEYRKRSHDESAIKEIPGNFEIRAKPGDVVIWDNRLWHSAWKRKDGHPRRNIFINYVRDPQNDPIRGREVRELISNGLKGPGRSYVYSKKLLSNGGQAREKMAARLEKLGIDNVREP